MNHDRLCELKARIKELNDKATQILLFLSFAMVAGVTLLLYDKTGVDRGALIAALTWWTVAVFPVGLCVLPVKDIAWTSLRWHKILVFSKFVLLWIAVGLIMFGAWKFIEAIQAVGRAPL